MAYFPKLLKNVNRHLGFKKTLEDIWRIIHTRRIVIHLYIYEIHMQRKRNHKTNDIIYQKIDTFEIELQVGASFIK